MITRILHAIVAKPFMYDLVQYLVVGESFKRRLRRFTASHITGIVLDIGCGTGQKRDLVEPSIYIGLDTDPVKIYGLLARKPNAGSVLLGDGMALCFSSKAIDSAMCVFVTHHLSDSELHRLLAEAARVVRGSFFVADPILHPSIISRLLWRYDRGRYPRTTAQLVQHLEMFFEIRDIDTFHHRKMHWFTLYLCTPRA